MRALLIVPGALAVVAFNANAQCSPPIQKLITDQKYDEARAEAQALIAKNASDDVALHCMGRVYIAMDKAGRRRRVVREGDQGERQGLGAPPVARKLDRRAGPACQ